MIHGFVYREQVLKIGFFDKRIISCCFPKLSTTALCIIGLSWWRHRKWGNTYKKCQFQNPVWKLFSLNSDSDWSELTEQQQTLQWKTKKRTLIFFLEVIFFLSYLKISKKYFSCIHRIRNLFHLDLRVDLCHREQRGSERLQNSFGFIYGCFCDFVQEESCLNIT